MLTMLIKLVARVLLADAAALHWVLHVCMIKTQLGFVCAAVARVQDAGCFLASVDGDDVPFHRG